MSDDQQSKDYDGKFIIGIDLGTTKSAVSAWRPKIRRVEMLPYAEDKDKDKKRTITQSVVAWDRTQQSWLVGDAAREKAIDYPGDVVYSIKRCIGRAFDSKHVRDMLPDLTYRLQEGGDDNRLRDVLVDFGDKPDSPRPHLVSAPEISAKILDKLRRDAAFWLVRDQDVPQEEEVKYAVITVPAYFDVLQRTATIEAGRLAGLTVVDILNEPTAAALAYGTAYEDVITAERQNLLVYDLGGGTFDVSVLDAQRFEDGGYRILTLGVDGDTHLGGDDIDNSVIRWLAAEILQRYKRPVRHDDYHTRALLRREAVRAKERLTDEMAVTIQLTRLDFGNGLIDVEIELTRDQLERCAADVIDRTCRITQDALKKQKMDWSDIDQIILVGGQTLMPAIQRAVRQLAGGKPRLRVLDWPQEAVARGAGEHARVRSLGLTASSEHKLSHVIALPLGTRIGVDTFRTVIDANQSVETESELLITTTQDNQQEIDVQVLQQTRGAKTAGDCTLLDHLVVKGIPPAPKGVPSFMLRFKVFDDGTIKVSVTDVSGHLEEHVLDIVESKTKTLMFRDIAGQREAMNPGESS